VRLTAEERLHLPRTPAPSVVLCRPDAWGRVSFAATPVSIVGWLYDPVHSFVVSTYGFLIERNRAFASVATTRSRLRRSRVDLASRSRRFRISTSTGSSRLGSSTRSGWATPPSFQVRFTKWRMKRDDRTAPNSWHICFEMELFEFRGGPPWGGYLFGSPMGGTTIFDPPWICGWGGTTFGHPPNHGIKASPPRVSPLDGLFDPPTRPTTPRPTSLLQGRVGYRHAGHGEG